MKPGTPNSRTSQTKDLDGIYQSKIKLKFYTFRTQTIAGRNFYGRNFGGIYFRGFDP